MAPIIIKFDYASNVIYFFFFSNVLLYGTHPYVRTTASRGLWLMRMRHVWGNCTRAHYKCKRWRRPQMTVGSNFTYYKNCNWSLVRMMSEKTSLSFGRVRFVWTFFVPFVLSLVCHTKSTLIAFWSKRTHDIGTPSSIHMSHAFCADKLKYI